MDGFEISQKVLRPIPVGLLGISDGLVTGMILHSSTSNSLIQSPIEYLITPSRISPIPTNAPIKGIKPRKPRQYKWLPVFVELSQYVTRQVDGRFCVFQCSRRFRKIGSLHI